MDGASFCRARSESWRVGQQETAVARVAALLLFWAAGCSGGMVGIVGQDADDGSEDVSLGDGDALDEPHDPADADTNADTDAVPDPADGGEDDGTATDEVEEGEGFIAPVDDPCLTLSPTIMGTDSGETLIGTDGPDIIFAGAGDDVIWGNNGDDIICAGGGEDEIHGGEGHDYIDAGFGRDWVDGGAGNDTIHGRSGGDTIRGGWGDDVLFGDLLDDELYGDEGNDILIGGHGTDLLHGGPDDDWLRGDTNKDTFIGGEGIDTASFMTATPPGQPLGDLAFAEGVLVDNRDISNGLSSGDGYLEPLQGVEHIVGSAFDDHLVTGAGTLSVSGGVGDDVIEASDGTAVDGGPGSDTCTPTPCEPGTDVPGRGDGPYVALATGPIDLGLVVIGSRGGVDDDLAISITPTGIAVVRAGNGAAITTGEGCHHGASASEARCVLPAELRYIVGYGDGGNDTFVIEGGCPRDLTATLDGGDGNDRLVGHDEQDILFAGATGNDELTGNGGDDALLSESRDADQMDAGAGNDQLVANYPCAGHSFVGGPGYDVGGFARVGTHFDTAAERHEQRILAQLGYRAYQPAFCTHDQGTQLADDIEILEGAGGDDELIGNDGNNIIWGWGGDDVIRGLDGNDTIEGHDGNDTLYGGSGRDRLRGGRGYNVLYARDGESDFELSCGEDGRLETVDSIDPAGEGCH
jgi:Ca2+-binding RTX toxin-like protein